MALAFPSPEDNCCPAVTYPFADPAGVPATLQDLARTDIQLDLRGLLKAGHTKTIQLCQRQRGNQATVSPNCCHRIYCPQMGWWLWMMYRALPWGSQGKESWESAPTLGLVFGLYVQHPLQLQQRLLSRDQDLASLRWVQCLAEVPCLDSFPLLL